MTLPSLTTRAREMLRLIHRTDGLSRSALIKLTGLSGTAVFRATEELEVAGLVTIGEAVAEGRGQPSAMIHARPDAVLGLGLSIMTDRADVVLIDLTGKVRAQREITVPGMPRDAIVDAAMAFARETAGAHGVPYARIAGLGVAVAGYFVEENSVNPGFELDDWALIDLHRAIADRIGLPVMIENIAGACAIGERLLGAAGGLDSFAYVSVAAGFGGAIISDRRLLRGQTGNAGEFGIFFSLLDRPTPNLVTLKEELEQHGVACADISDLVARFHPGWPGIDQWIAAHVDSFSRLFAILRNTLDSEAIVLGGRLPRPLAQRIIDAARWPEASEPPRRDRPLPNPRLMVAGLPPEQSAPLGAASLILARDVLG